MYIWNTFVICSTSFVSFSKCCDMQNWCSDASSIHMSSKISKSIFDEFVTCRSKFLKFLKMPTYQHLKFAQVCNFEKILEKLKTNCVQVLFVYIYRFQTGVYSLFVQVERTNGNMYIIFWICLKYIKLFNKTKIENL